MLTEKRHEMILDALRKHHFLSLQHLIEYTGCSASTMRRDLTKLQEEGWLIRVHGGAKLTQAQQELALDTKRTQHIDEKIQIAQQAAQLIKDGDCIYIDAGSTTLEMIAHIKAKEITVVTNGLPHVEALIKKGFLTRIVGGSVKATTMAVVGSRAADSLKHYSFNKVFLGINGIDCDAGLTTPDEQEAFMKENAMRYGLQTYILADASKFYQSYFARIHTEEAPIIITSTKAFESHNLSRFKDVYEFLGGAL
ncbi:DeoR/GlpR family DNA-binding transcription regulator [Staphylococcus chromogenes]|uniref:DeoR/GlpR family DNA-binding transcription regulator n=1 Tax=Staphylococcus chromogenes TaxID=46126 RepID=UPI000D1B4E63|nr:DeoR/GlpR family DNA-binding transcription regulator [Staphylococcus chromogenes]MDT0692912.1 DeoR/GlpR family DNA-binding transcription regulator [Staphylococcus chromogenes]MDT0699333.1 DeoR/GlpR family DNA-binding transcription regulator [Staphylococcus chromogenes]MDU0451132.1 DeoR/GlpR family DNA-binding transcription regulator [Staphylococcus chromogenes]PTF73069.1 DeoR family transcriptional regulator [Staphylococcus chromogenes]PTF73494.1 DeoR family transcriptional regulator [Staph